MLNHRLFLCPILQDLNNQIGKKDFLTIFKNPIRTKFYEYQIS